MSILKSKFVSDKMNVLDKAALEINKVTESISDISEQTNLLALVSSVASEVTQDIQQVNRSATQVSSGSQQVNNSAVELSNLSEQLNQLTGKFKFN